MAHRVSSFKWSQTVAADLQRIAEFIRDFNPRLEQETVSAIIERATALRQYPRIGQRREVYENGTELRALLAGKRYRVIYEVHFNDDVEIMQVLDVRSDNR